MTTNADGTVPRRYVIGARKIPYADRDVAHDVMATSTARDPRNWRDVIDAGDQDDVPLGADVTYAIDLTEQEADRFRAASNARYVELDQVDTMDVMTVRPARVAADTVMFIPPVETMRYMGADFAGVDDWHGKDVSIAVLDGGTTPAVKARFEWVIVARQDFVRGGENTDLITVNHGCLVTPEAVPHGGKLIEAIVFDEGGSAYHSWVAAAIKWACDRGAIVINYSGSGAGTSGTQRDALMYAQARGVVIVASAGNDGEYRLGYPAKHCEDFENVVSSIAFDEATDDRADFSNHFDTASGCAPGSRCLSVDENAVNVRWSGTSSSAPKMTLLIAMACTGRKYKAVEVARALEVNARDTAEPVSEEGAGPWHLETALRKLGAFTVIELPVPPPAILPAPPVPRAHLMWLWTLVQQMLKKIRRV